jgi:hypothetical protein
MASTILDNVVFNLYFNGECFFKTRFVNLID